MTMLPPPMPPPTVRGPRIEDIARRTRRARLIQRARTPRTGRALIKPSGDALWREWLERRRRRNRELHGRTP